MTETKQTRSELKRSAILSAANIAFRQDGVKATSMDKIAELAQVSKRTVYNHFATKETLVFHLISQLWDDAVMTTGLSYQADLPIKQQLTDILLTEMKTMASEGYIELVRVALGHFLFEASDLQEEMCKIHNTETDLERWLKSAVADEKLRIDDVKIAMEQLHSLLKGVCFWPQLIRVCDVLTEAESEALVNRSVDMFLNQYAVNEEN
ncbi:TetR/AcrR family transcriptional regulator [Psychrobium sp. MM17-31]|uniref:TetR/AcrR family transcriptional regulator n=1 Tax=Psychrobium sp. MM17-31 TaxID=2917758 RepID=UPI001EF435D4|nr:TetR/AcrR family transcriptional regulator [Psychrobium sp. MM17-31]MCG7533050.1 TetR/AcrR family transcriptional regulator [Psychrobium sp. MM17-31]